MAFQYIKAIHIIFVVAWFAGLFYIVRLFIYHVESEEKPSPEREILQRQYKLMAYRLWYIITWPAAIITLILGTTFLVTYPYLLRQPWMHIKLTLVLGLFAYQWACHRIYKQLQCDEIRYSSNQLRLWNEVATLFLVGIVFIVVLKNTLNMLYGLIGLICFGLLLMLGIRVYKRIRGKNSGR